HIMNTPIREAYQYEELEDEIISMDKYISFIADTDGWLYENLSDAVNNTFNEYGNIEEPTLCNRFDGSSITDTDLNFENRIFTLLHVICLLLNNYKTSSNGNYDEGHNTRFRTAIPPQIGTGYLFNKGNG